MGERFEAPRWLVPPLGILAIALTAWIPRFDNPTFGLDPSWQGGLHMAVEQGLDFGTEAVFTHGPLGFLGLQRAILWDGDLAALAFVYQAILFLALCACLYLALRRSVGAVLAIPVAFAAIVLTDDAEQALVVSVALSLALLSADRPAALDWSLIAAAAVLAAFGVLIKLSVGPVLLGLPLLSLAVARGDWRRVLGYLAAFAAATALLWLAVHGGFASLPDYLRNGREVISGYSAAMPVTVEPKWNVAAMLGAGVALVVATAVLLPGAARRRVAATLIVLACAFALFKQGVVRLGAENTTIFYSTAALLWLVLPWRGRGRIPLLAGLAVLIGLSLSSQLVSPVDRANPLANVDAAIDGARTLAAPDSRVTMSEGAAAAMRDAYALDERVLAAIGERSVSIEPWEIGVAWAYGLDWDPAPVLQNYNAWTADLDRLNAEAIAAGSGPEVVLRHDLPPELGSFTGRTIDTRFAGWDPPAQAVATLCNFAPSITTSRWQLLERVPERCGPMTSLGTEVAAEGESVAVPEPRGDEVVLVRIEGTEPSGLDALRTLLYRAEQRTALLDNGAYRVVPGTAGNGLLLRGPTSVLGRGRFAQAPQAATIAIVGGEDELSYEFLSMPVEPMEQERRERAE